MEKELVLPPNDIWQETWVREASDRVAAYERGEIEAEDFDTVMERLHKKLNSIKTT